MNDPRNESLLRLAALRESLIQFVKPKIFSKLIDLCEALGTDRNSFIQQYKFWLEKNGPDCRYAAMTKEFFLKDQAKGVAKEINWLYHNFSKYYEDR
jgi:hypothetical protein